MYGPFKTVQPIVGKQSQTAPRYWGEQDFHSIPVQGITIHQSPVLTLKLCLHVSISMLPTNVMHECEKFPSR